MKKKTIDKNPYMRSIAYPSNVKISKDSWVNSYDLSNVLSKRKLAVRIDSNTGINNGLIQLGENGELEIGKYCTIIQPIFNTNKKIIIGDYALIAYETIFSDNGFPIPYEKNDRKVEKSKVSIRIGDNVWVCIGAIILEGADIGDNSIIAAGAMVDSKVPANSLVVGNPGRIIKQIK